MGHTHKKVSCKVMTTENQQGYQGIRGHWGPLRGFGTITGCRGVRGALGASRECRYSGASRSRGSIRVIGGLLGAVRVSGPWGSVRGVGVSGMHWGLAGTVGAQGPARV